MYSLGYKVKLVAARFEYDSALIHNIYWIKFTLLEIDYDNLSSACKKDAKGIYSVMSKSAFLQTANKIIVSLRFTNCLFFVNW